VKKREIRKKKMREELEKQKREIAEVSNSLDPPMVEAFEAKSSTTKVC